MPTETFLQLPEIKREAFIEAALREFAENNYETASINQVIKVLNIARGSVYQYFTDKLDLWLYLKEYAEQRKVKHIQMLDRDNYPDFWTYYEDLYLKGIQFDMEEPLCSRFLYRVGFQESSKVVAPYLDQWKIKAKEMFTAWVENEKNAGFIRADIKTDIAVQFILSAGLGLGEMIQQKYAGTIQENFRAGTPLYQEVLPEYETMVKTFIHLLKTALNPIA